MIRFATPALVPDLKTMWQVCFSEQQEYVDFAFDRIIRPERVLAALDDAGRPVSMLCIQPALFTGLQYLSCKGAYIYGVATLPEARGKGLSTKLMEGAHKALKKQGFALSALVPASESLFGFYGERGYETAFSICKREVPGAEITPAPGPCVLTPATLASMEQERNEVFGGSGLYVRWDRDYLMAVDAECRLSGGEVLRATWAGGKGYAVCYRYGDTVVIKETTIPPELLDTVLGAIHTRMNAGRYHLYLREEFGAKNNASVLPFAMVRWYDKKIRTSFGQLRGEAPYIAHVLD